MRRFWFVVSLLPLCACGGGSAPTSSPGPAPSVSPLPLKASSNNRYLVDQNGVPTLLVGDSSHAMFANLNAKDLATYLANRKSHGFNIVWVQSLCSDYITNCRSDLSTSDGLIPFTSGTNQANYDISMPNPDYWARIDNYVKTAGDYGITILFDTWETGALMPLARASGNAKMRDFGVFLGNRYKSFPNIIWITGNDFQTWANPTDNALIQSLMAGITSADPRHLHTTELNYFASGSMDNPLFVPYTTLAGAYDYYCSYGQALAQYNHPTAVPVFFEEGYYEFNTSVQGNVTTPLSLRTQEWWATLAGATAGQMYGSTFIHGFAPGWQNYLDTLPVTQLGYLTSLLKSIAWFNLVPDQNHKIVTSGYGTPDAGETASCVNTNDYVTTSYLADGSASVSYVPKGNTVIVDLSTFRGTVTAKWYDPASGAYSPISGSPFTNAGIQNFPTPGTNSAGDPDWVLLLASP
jgi:hypothetical protein